MTAVVGAVLPVFVIAAAGYTIRRIFPIQLKTLSILNIYILGLLQNLWVNMA